MQHPSALVPMPLRACVSHRLLFDLVAEQGSAQESFPAVTPTHAGGEREAGRQGNVAWLMVIVAEQCGAGEQPDRVRIKITARSKRVPRRGGSS